MSTVATGTVKQLASDWETKCGLKSAKLSGVIGDARHQSRGGYHIGRAYQPSTNYSVVRPDDKEGPSDAAAAIDMTMSPAGMRTCTNRLVVAFNDTSDPRRKYINAFNGTLDGKFARRWDVYARKIKAATADHLWHVHLEIRRKYVNSATAADAILSLLRGESLGAYLKRVSPVSSLAASAKSTSTTSAPTFPGTLRRNDSQTKPDPGTRIFQTQMIKRGWKSLVADGYFGPKLEAAVKAFQKSAGLTTDGVVGPKTWGAAWTRPYGGTSS